jgi:hypothetical protein
LGNHLYSFSDGSNRLSGFFVLSVKTFRNAELSAFWLGHHQISDMIANFVGPQLTIRLRAIIRNFHTNDVTVAEKLPLNSLSAQAIPDQNALIASRYYH